MQNDWTEYTEFLEQGCDAALFVAMHAKAGTPDGVMSHTVSGQAWKNLSFNGVSVGETGINAALCGQWDCPVLLVTGDEATCTEATAVARGRSDDGRREEGTGPLQRTPADAAEGARADRGWRQAGL